MKAGKFSVLLLGAVVALCIKESEETIPVSMLMRMNHVNSTEAFIMNFLRRANHSSDMPDTPSLLLPGENDLFVPGVDVPDPVGASMMAEMVSPADHCSPKLTSVPVPEDSDPNVIMWPMCVEVEQCGGCCGETLECAPSVIEVHPVTVLRARYPYLGAPNFDFDGMETRMVQRHLGCECRCRTQPSHCDLQLQEYMASACRCRCRNEHLATSCRSPQAWDQQRCACLCPPLRQPCLGDERFNDHSCRCERVTPEDPDEGLVDVSPPEPDACAGVRCRTGFRPVAIGTICRCMVDARGQMEGMAPINPGQPTTTPRPQLSRPRPRPRPRGRNRARLPTGSQRRRLAPPTN